MKLCIGREVKIIEVNNSMKKQTAIKLFEQNEVRTHWDEDAEKWYFSVVDVIKMLTESSNPRRYWSNLKIKLNNEGSQLYEEIVQLKMQSVDGKFYRTDKAEKRPAQVLVNDCGSGVTRHADAGYELAIKTAKEYGLNLPMVD